MTEEKGKDKSDKSDVIFVKSKVRDYVHTKECNAAGDVLDGPALDKIIKDVLDKAIERAKANGRKTVMDKDL